ncbi:DNA cytosine methyltransferase [Kitasatospora sp. CMC57]|uniref:DNA (cytosine-5-)-methyltransferase n=1 Tax=Kitasatospora sp. CMC57 TaxID=3231513 RepID=A0AB33JWB4_9ACTN
MPSTISRFRPPPTQSSIPHPALSCIEICAGAGGQSLGLERAGFSHDVLVEIDADACATLRANRPNWTVLQADLRTVNADDISGMSSTVGLLAGGVPCPPFSLAGRQLGAADDRDLFPEVLRLMAQIRPRVLLIENVKGLLQARFDAYRTEIISELSVLGYMAEWRLLRACDFGVPQLRPRAVLIAMPAPLFAAFSWPTAQTSDEAFATVGQVLYESMASGGWELAESWAAGANQIAPTLCGGSRRHGGPDLGPSRARQAWARLGVQGSSIANSPPGPGDQLPVRLTVDQMALLQGFPAAWRITGTKTARYRQVGNAFPPPVAAALGRSIAAVLIAEDSAASRPLPISRQRSSQPSLLHGAPV